MTKETKKLFDAPWVLFSDPDNLVYQIESNTGSYIADAVMFEDAKRIIHLPELYDALHEAADGKCWSCAAVNVDTVLDKGCPKGHNRACYVARWIELLRKVREGI